MQNNEREFASLLASLRRGVYIPEQVDAKYKAHIHQLLKGFVEDYRILLAKQIKAAANFELEGRKLEGAKYLKAAEAKGVVPK